MTPNQDRSALFQPALYLTAAGTLVAVDQRPHLSRPLYRPLIAGAAFSRAEILALGSAPPQQVGVSARALSCRRCVCIAPVVYVQYDPPTNNKIGR